MEYPSIQYYYTADPVEGLEPTPAKIGREAGFTQVASLDK